MDVSISKTLVAVVAFERISPFHLSVPCIVFGEGIAADNPFQVVVCSAEGGTLSSNAGFHLSGLASLEVLEQAEVVVVPSWCDVNQVPPPALLLALRRAHARGAYVVGLCLGAHVLAEAGLLDRRRATTHWEYAPEMALRFPAVKVMPDVLYVEEERILTSAGTVAGIDACLHILRQRLGAAFANRVARRLVTPPHRTGGQAQFIEQPLPKTAGGTRLAQLMESVRQRLQQEHSLDSLAAEACMSRRSFTRQFKALTGTTVLAWLLAERLRLCQQLLEQTDLGIERVAELSGFGTVEAMRQHFRAAYRVSPSQWRRSFSHALAE